MSVSIPFTFQANRLKVCIHTVQSTCNTDLALVVPICTHTNVLL